MASTIETVATALAVNSVGSTTLTAIEQNPETGFYERQIRVYEMTDVGDPGQLILTLTVRSATRAGVAMKTPELTF